jgi:hypothetical protein
LMRDFFIGLITILFIGTMSLYFVEESMPDWKEDLISAMDTFAEELKVNEKLETSKENWKKIREKFSKLPNVYPISNLKASIFEVPKILKTIDDIKSINVSSKIIENSEISTKEFFQIFESIDRIDKSLIKIKKEITGIWDFLLTDKQQEFRAEKIAKLEKLRGKLKEIKYFENMFREFAKNEERILIVLQNENEPRSSGGFMGSFIIVDFSSERISWKFQDIYSIDRRIPARIQIPAPEFFHGLSKTISLRDSNIYPDFPTTAGKIREFMAYAGEKSPETVIAINTSIIKEALKITGPVKLDRWGMVLDQFNFDLVLEFLIESKVAGRYDVKSPLMDFAQELFSVLQKTVKNNFSVLKEFDLEKFIKGKNILANSRDLRLQQLFEKWKIDGKLAKKRDANNFLQFDFVSVGANKSEKFVWTKIVHNSSINNEGIVLNTLKIARSHALHNGEINELLDTDLWSENIKDLLNDDILWKLGAGQNRTILRVTVPNSAKLILQESPSGEIFQKKSEVGDFQVFEIPMFVLPGEKLNIILKYETQIEQGSHNWRPYFLQMVGTPAKQKTAFLETISTKNNGKFSAETYNIGKPVNLVDQDFRAVIRF